MSQVFLFYITYEKQDKKDIRCRSDKRYQKW